ncbi:autotransporter outer membrane beta-barrel domain-containing protein [Enterobacterales bacterium AE_CKDN230030158-1A_HGKHYDSX7]
MADQKHKSACFKRGAWVSIAIGCLTLDPPEPVEAATLYWDGGNASLYNNNAVDGGSGTWLAAGNTAWTNLGGTLNSPWTAGDFAVFQGAPGTVTVDGSGGSVIIGGAQFAVTGYVLGGAPLVTSTPGTVIAVGNGSGAGAAFSAVIGNEIQGTGGLNKTDLGTLILSGDSTYTGGTTLSAGTLQLGNGGASGTLLGNIVNNATLVFNRNATQIYPDIISGSGSLIQAGSGTSILTGANSYTGGTTISAGTLQVGNNNFVGSIVGDVVNNSALIFARTNFLTYSGTISGSGSVTQAGGGTLILTGNSTYTGVTNANAGRLRLTGTLTASNVNVANGATLSGTGTAGATVTVQNGGHLSPGVIGNAGTFAIGQALNLASSAVLDYELGQANSVGGALNDLLNVGGNLQLDGVLNITPTTGGTFGPGAYRLINYSGSLSNNGLSFGSLPAGANPNVNLFIQTLTPGQVNLVYTLGLGPTTFWDGGNTALYNNNAVNGGSGTWQVSTSDAAWTDSTGSANVSWQNGGFATFAGTPGTVTVDNSAGAVIFSGAQFAVNGYVLGGGPLVTNTAGSVLQVGDGTAAGSGMSATISASLQGTGGLVKTDLGRLILTGLNTYSGGTTISGGNLQLGNLGVTGSVLGNILNNAALTFSHVDNLVYGGVISGSGSVTQQGAGLVLTGDNTYTGGTTVSAGTLNLGNGGTTGSVVGNIVNGSNLVFNRSNDLTYAGVISGTGDAVLSGTGRVILTGNSLYTGGTFVNAGTLQIGAGGTSGSLTGDILNNSALVFNRSDALTFAGTISGSGSLTQAGSGVTNLTGASNYTGATLVNAGTLRVNGSLGATTTTVASGATLGGGGTLGGSVNILAGGHLAPGNSPGTLGIAGDLNLASGAILDYELGQANTPGGTLNDLATVGGNVQLDGTLNVGVASGGSFGPGVYRLFAYGGSLTDNGLDFGSVPAGSTPNVDLRIQTSVTQQVNLVNSLGVAVNFWDGDSSGLFNNGAVNGGSGTWLASPGNDAWTDVSGSLNAPWQADGFAIFQGAPGTVTVDNSAGAVSFGGAQFAVNGYTLAGGPLTTSSAATLIRVGDGSAASAGMGATLATVIQGSGGLVKSDTGTLNLTAVNTYTGATDVQAGTLRLTGVGSLGTGGVNLQGTGTLLVEAPASGSFTFNNALTGSGRLQVNLANTSDSFSFGAGSGSAFAGTAALGTGSFALAAGNTAALAQATLQLNAGNSTTVGAGTQSLGNLTLFGGTLIFSDSTSPGISTGVLNLGSGFVRVDPGSASSSGTLLAQDEGTARQLIAASSVSGATAGLTLADLSGNPISAGILPIVQGGNTVAQGSYGFGLGIGASAGLYATYGLTQLDLQAGQTTSLSGDSATPAGANELHARLTGAGNLAIDASTAITLNNSGNDYTGQTLANSGALILESDHALGNSSSLIVANGATVDLNGKAQTVGSLLGAGSVDVHGGALTLSNGGVFSGAIDGTSGSLALGGGSLILTGANSFIGNTTVQSGAVMQLGNGGTSGSYAGPIANNGTLIFDRSDAVIHAGSIAGSGTLNQVGAGLTTLTGNNPYSGGTSISAGTLAATQAAALGSGAIDNNAILQLAFDSPGVLSNLLSGSGTLVKTGSEVAELRQAGSSQGNVQVLDGTLRFAQDGGFTVSGDYIAVAGSTTGFLQRATLSVGNQFNLDGTLNNLVGNASAVITAASANLGAGSVFNLGGYSAPPAASASELAFSIYRELHTTAPGGLTGTFSGFSIGGSSSPVDFLTLTPFHTAQDFDVGLALSWYAAHSATPQNADGRFTLSDAAHFFDMDVVLADEAANPTTGWDGKTLTKLGQGTLRLSRSNTYSGATLVEAGTLQAGAADVIAASSQLTIAQGARFDLNDFNQQVRNLTGAGAISLGSATLNVTNDSATVFDGPIVGTGSLIKSGAGSLTLSTTAAYTGLTRIDAGTLQLGNGGPSGGVAGDILNNSSLIFDRSDDLAYDAVISGSGDLSQNGGGRLLLSRDQSYTGSTAINSGALILTHGARLLSGQPVTVASGATLGGYGGIGGDVDNQGLLAVADAAPGFEQAPAGVFLIGGQLLNSGEVRMASPVPASTLVVAGDYVGNGGLLTLSTVLGGDNSATDKLVVQGNTSGSTRVVVNNSGGTGAQTRNGIQIIEVQGVSAGSFALQGRLVAGAFEYQLRQGTPSGNDGNWYLSSQSNEPVPPTPPNPTPPTPPRPQLRPEAGSYLANQYAASSLFIHTLRDRKSDPQWPGAESAGNGWIRVRAGSADSQAAGGRLDQSYDSSLVHFGADLIDWQDAANRVQIGVMGAAGQVSSRSRVDGLSVHSKGDVDGYAAGVYLTWHPQPKDDQSGFYLDTWSAYGWYDNQVDGDGLPSEDYDSSTWTTSLEVGHATLVQEQPGSRWYIEPQVQVLYIAYDQDNVTETNGTRVQSDDVDGWVSRLGARLHGQQRTGSAAVLQPFMEVNWWHSQHQASVRMGGTRVNDDLPRDRYEVKLGAQHALAERWNLWGEVGVQSGQDDYSSLQGQIGVQILW